jgi:phosphoribosylformylglycinamidine (FGAM) synthase-like amidotransferase family enzyme
MTLEQAWEKYWTSRMGPRLKNSTVDAHFEGAFKMQQERIDELEKKLAISIEVLTLALNNTERVTFYQNGVLVDMLEIIEDTLEQIKGGAE